MEAGCLLEQVGEVKRGGFSLDKSTKQSFALHINDYKCCHEKRFESPKCLKMRLRHGSYPDPAGGAYSAPQTPSYIFVGGEVGKRKGKEKWVGKGKGEKESKGKGKRLVRLGGRQGCLLAQRGDGRFWRHIPYVSSIQSQVIGCGN